MNCSASGAAGAAQTNRWSNSMRTDVRKVRIRVILQTKFTTTCKSPLPYGRQQRQNSAHLRYSPLQSVASLLSNSAQSCRTPTPKRQPSKVLRNSFHWNKWRQRSCRLKTSVGQQPCRLAWKTTAEACQCLRQGMTLPCLRHPRSVVIRPSQIQGQTFRVACPHLQHATCPCVRQTTESWYPDPKRQSSYHPGKRLERWPQREARRGGTASGWTLDQTPRLVRH